ncbi:MAG: hypothetical protein EX285_02075 [Thaumarchaeota archaeon]|nr:hypothetical protein [Nitrososphaerota archaeon]
MKIARKLTTISTKLDEDQLLLLQQIATEEGKTISGITKIAIDQFLQQQASYIGLKRLFTSGIFEKLTPETLGIIVPIIKKAFESLLKDLSNAKERYPELARLEYQLKTELVKVENDINAYLDPKKHGRGRSNKYESKPKGMEQLSSYNELKAITSKLDGKTTKVKKRSKTLNRQFSI